MPSTYVQYVSSTQSALTGLYSTSAPTHPGSSRVPEDAYVNRGGVHNGLTMPD